MEDQFNLIRDKTMDHKNEANIFGAKDKIKI